MLGQPVQVFWEKRGVCLWGGRGTESLWKLTAGTEKTIYKNNKKQKSTTVRRKRLSFSKCWALMMDSGHVMLPGVTSIALNTYCILFFLMLYFLSVTWILVEYSPQVRTVSMYHEMGPWLTYLPRSPTYNMYPNLQPAGRVWRLETMINAKISSWPKMIHPGHYSLHDCCVLYCDRSWCRIIHFH